MQCNFCEANHYLALNMIFNMFFSITTKTTFEAFRRSDMYSLALLMWEVLRRTEVITEYSDDTSTASSLSMPSSEPFALPYFDAVSPDPGFEEMRKIVCVEGRRPEIHDRLAGNKVCCWGLNSVIFSLIFKLHELLIVTFF